MRRLLLALALLLLAAAPAHAADAGAYLERSLDGRGCAREPGGTATVNLTSWVALGLVASRRSASRAADCIATHARHLRTATDLEMAILGLVAAGRDPRRAGGRDLVAALVAQTRSDRIGPTVGSNQFGIFALRAVGVRVPAAIRTTLLRDRTPAGLWPVARGGDADSNLTASGIAAAVAAGVPPTDASLGRAANGLRAFRRGGGYALLPGTAPDAQSTAWVLQGLAALGRRDAGAERFLRGLQQPDGSFAYQRGTRITPVWVTAQAAVGLARRPFPLRP